MIANQNIESMSHEALEELQFSRLQKQVRWAYEKSAFYHDLFDKAGVVPDEFRSLADIQKIPYMERSKLLETSIYDLLTLPLSGVLRISRQGEGNTLIKMYTSGDVARQMEMMTRVLVAYGINETTVVGLLGEASDSRLMDVQYALEGLGASVMLMGSNMDNIIELMTKCHVDVLISDFRLITQLIVKLQANGDNAQDLYVPSVICLEETLYNPMRAYIDRRMNVNTKTVYNSSCLGCAGIMYQCRIGKGFHINEDYFYPEIVEFGAEKVITEPQRVGELVITTLTSEAMPIFRLRTGQAVLRLDGECECGRSFIRVVAPTEYEGTFA
ncbi:MAG: phenylacetate--CoA ligase family protein [Anaerovibrio sp.]|uniref:phenylacetate--CoA ligase family protein n=1 Tax=Anaerovibrio sp. TaxID=1872532 RepID=UPI0025FC8173|nr:phenylacetate--CoA ligase family protein [Anaerovibrio sp.]MCR5177040.1 phenylacetate--CoA ligase family protein [Anaerovibrio sp.]